MRATLCLATAIFALGAASASAQTYVKKIIEPVAPTVDDIINAPIEYDNNGVVKAQYFKADDLSEAEYRALLEEADRIRAYQDATGGRVGMKLRSLSRLPLSHPAIRHMRWPRPKFRRRHQVEFIVSQKVTRYIIFPKDMGLTLPQSNLQMD